MGSQLDEIAETPYFSPQLNSYLAQLQDVVKKLLAIYPTITSDVMGKFIDEIGSATKFLSGSTSKRIPYEIVYSLRLALSNWTTKDALITTAISPDFKTGFYFQGVSETFRELSSTLLGIKFEQQLVQISLPQLYRHRPIYNIPLFHELGHFIDIHHQITTVALLLNDEEIVFPGVADLTVSNEQLNIVQRRHLMEYFADIFAASYIGLAYHGFLKSFAQNNPIALTHPATVDRLRLIEDFLNGKSNPILNILNLAVKALNLPELKISYSVPNISDSFDDIRPFALSTDEEVHGIFLAAWDYLEQKTTSPDGHWAIMNENQIEKTINNLVEKSIRNRMVTERWRLGLTHS